MRTLGGEEPSSNRFWRVVGSVFLVLFITAIVIVGGGLAERFGILMGVLVLRVGSGMTDVSPLSGEGNRANGRFFGEDG